MELGKTTGNTDVMTPLLYVSQSRCRRQDARFTDIACRWVPQDPRTSRSPEKMSMMTASVRLRSRALLWSQAVFTPHPDMTTSLVGVAGEASWSLARMTKPMPSLQDCELRKLPPDACRMVRVGENSVLAGYKLVYKDRDSRPFYQFSSDEIHSDLNKIKATYNEHNLRCRCQTIARPTSLAAKIGSQSVG